MQWRGKLLFAMILYAAGFATAIYVLAPADVQAADGRDGCTGWSQEQTTEQAGVGIDAQAWAASVRVGMSKAASFAEEKALVLAEAIKARMEQSEQDRGD